MSRIFVWVVAAASLSACSDLGPFDALRLSVTVAPESLIPSDSLAVRIVIFNPSAYDVKYEPCQVGFELLTPAGETWGGGAEQDPCFRPDSWGYPVGEDDLRATGGRTERKIPARDSLVVILGWRHFLQQTPTDPPPPGLYRLRATIRGDGYALRSDAHSVTILPWSALRVVHSAASAGPMAVEVSGRVMLRDVMPLTRSPQVVVPAGPQLVVLRSGPSGPSLGQGTIDFRIGRQHLLGIGRAYGWHVPLDVTDDRAPSATPGQGALRIVHLAESAADVSVSWAAPNGPSVVRTFPLSYGTASPYRLGGAGTWQVRVVSANGVDTLYAPGPLPVRGGETRTLVLMAAPSGAMIAGLFAP